MKSSLKPCHFRNWILNKNLSFDIWKQYLVDLIIHEPQNIAFGYDLVGMKEILINKSIELISVQKDDFDLLL